MTAKLADRVKESSTSTGTGTINLDGAVSGFQTFVAGIGNGNSCYYCIAGGAEWEVGIGTVTDATPDTLSRTTVLASSNSGSLVSFSSGTKDVFCTAPASYLSTPLAGSAVGLRLQSQTAFTCYMTVPDNTALDATTGVSVSVWGYPLALTSTPCGIFSKATAAGGTGAAACGDYAFDFSSTAVDFGINGSGSCAWGAIANWTHALDSNRWSHIVGTYSTAQGNAKLYIDGILRATSSAYSSNINTTGTIGVLGAFYDKSGADRCWRGFIDDLRIYKNAALTADDITALYNGGIGQFPLNQLSANETVCWRFDEGSGTTATDSVAGLVLTAGGTATLDWVRGIINGS